MTKKGYKLSEDHKRNIGNATKMMWERGDFDRPEIREKWRQTALSGIAKKGRKNPNKYVPSQEMLDDYSSMGDTDISKKYGVSRRLVIKIRKDYNLPRFNNQHGLRPHEIRDGKEYKWCGSGHWELVENFGAHSSRYDGLRGHCKYHSNQSSRKSKQKEYDTPLGRSKVRMRNQMRRDGYVLWEPDDEVRAMKAYENRCAYCGTKINSRTVEFDHFFPISKGGKTLPSNMVPSCVECNRGVGGKKAKDTFEWLCKKYGNDIGQAIYEGICEKQNWIALETKKRVQEALEVIGDEDV